MICSQIAWTALIELACIEMASNLSKLIRTPEDGSVVAQVRDGVKNWLVQDHLGSTIALTDANGAIKRTYNYDIDGNATTAPVGAAPNPETWIKYAGGHDIGGGLYHYGARFYQPSAARWTQMDPLQQPGDLREFNRYGYVGGDPINGVDPSGLISCSSYAATGPQYVGACAGVKYYNSSPAKACRVGLGLGGVGGIIGDVLDRKGYADKTNRKPMVKGRAGAGARLGLIGAVVSCGLGAAYDAVS